MFKLLNDFFKAVAFLSLIIAFNSSFAQRAGHSDVHVNGYYKSNGTYVAPHYRTAPNSSNRDNFSTLGNINPYTGKLGHVAPDYKPLKDGYSDYSRYPEFIIPNTYPSSTDSEKFNIKLDKNGQFRAYHNNGKLAKKGFFKDGMLNGMFSEYDEQGNLMYECILKNGKLNGTYKKLYWNGNVKKIGTFSDGVETGKFIEYNEEGGKIAEGFIKDGKLSGIVKIFENDKLTHTINFVDGIKHGRFNEYSYNNGNLLLKTGGNYLNNLPNGKWTVNIIENGVEKTLNYCTFSNGIKNGNFQEIRGDSLILGSYKDGMLDGKYTIYYDLANRLIFGGIIRTDTAYLNLLIKGEYSFGQRSGCWKFYEGGNKLTSEGCYITGLMNGEWKYYYPTIVDSSGNPMHYSNKLYLIKNFVNGKQNGKSLRFSFLNEKKIPCHYSQNDTKQDSCVQLIYETIEETAFYDNDLLCGTYELKDSLGQYIEEGEYLNGLKNGIWLEGIDIVKELLGGVKLPEQSKSNVYFYFKGLYNKGLREGEWIQYINENNILETFNYKNGELDGEYIWWGMNSRKDRVKHFTKGILNDISVYDSLGLNIIKKYELYDIQSTSYRFRLINYSKDGSVSQEYWVNKENIINHYNIEQEMEAETIDYGFSRKGYRDGEYKKMDIKNNPKVIGHYTKGTNSGIWTNYYDNGVYIQKDYSDLRGKEIYKNMDGSNFSGVFIIISKTKKIREERKIKNGLRNGKTVYKDMNSNKIVRIENFKNGIVKV